MPKLKPLESGLNAFTLTVPNSALKEIRSEYTQSILPILQTPIYKKNFEGGDIRRHAIATKSGKKYFLTNYGNAPLIWLSNDCEDSYSMFKQFFNALEIEQEVSRLIDVDKKVVMYSGFYVLGNRQPKHLWHVDYAPDANAYTLIVPLTEIQINQGHLLYKTSSEKINTYTYKENEAIIFGDRFIHSTEPYNRSSNIRALVSITFGTDKIKYWPTLQKTIGDQARYTILPCGHKMGSCQCIAQSHSFNTTQEAAIKLPSNKIGRNQPCPCGSGKKYKRCHGAT